MKPASFIFIAILCVGDLIEPSCCFWGRLKSKITNSAINGTISQFDMQHRVIKLDDSLTVTFDEKPIVADYDADAAESLKLDGSTAISGFQEEGRFFKWYPLHIFIKNKNLFAKFSTTITTVTEVSALTIQTVCVVLSSVTGPCQVSRRLFRSHIQDPIKLSFDGDVDSIDGTVTPSKTVG